MARIRERNQLPPFLEVDPPHWAARGVSYLLILFFFMVSVASFVIRVSQTVSSPFSLLPMQGTDPMRALYDGTILEVRASEGQVVKKGSPIFIMRAEDAVDRASEYKTLETKLKGSNETLSNVSKK